MIQFSVHYTVDEYESRIVILPFIRQWNYDYTELLNRDKIEESKRYHLLYDFINPPIHRDNFMYYYSGNTIFYDPL